MLEMLDDVKSYPLQDPLPVARLGLDYISILAKVLLLPFTLFFYHYTRLSTH